MSDPTPDEMAIKQNFWTIQIRALDQIVDGLRARADAFAESGYTTDAGALRASLDTIRTVRNKLLAENYDANRKGEAVKK